MPTMLETLLDPVRRADAARDQAALQPQMVGLLPSRLSQSHYFYGQARERQAFASLESLYSTDNADSPVLEQFLDQLAEGYALQCRFVEAAATASNAARKAEYEAKAAAVASTGAQRCMCPASVTVPWPGDAKGKRYPSSTAIETLWDGRREVTIYRCRLCGALSAMET